MEKISYSKSRQSVGVIVAGFLIIAYKWEVDYLLYTAILLGVLALISKKIADYIHWAWMKLAWILSMIFPPILLSIIFYFILTPIAFLFRIINRSDTLLLKQKLETTFRSRNKRIEREDFEKTW